MNCPEKKMAPPNWLFFLVSKHKGWSWPSQTIWKFIVKKLVPLTFVKMSFFKRLFYFIFENLQLNFALIWRLVNESLLRMVKKVKKGLTLDSLIYVLLVLIFDFKRGSGYFCFYCAFFEWQVGALSCNMGFLRQ
jgi:hypothetical protein